MKYLNTGLMAIISLFSLCTLTGKTMKQTPARPATVAIGQPVDLFDFWVGDWDISWTNAQGQLLKGSNQIVKILDGKVIEENFVGSPASVPVLKGKSVSVYSTAKNVWRQTWVDNQGGYISLTAKVDGEKRIFETDPVKRNGAEIIQRMVFHDIQKDSFIWDWEGSRDGGKTWNNLWKIEYRRKKSQ